MSFDYLLTALVVALLPGTGVLYTLAQGLGQGRRASLFAALGCTLGIVPHMLATIAGLAAVIQTSAVVFETVKYLGVAYLFYMAWGVLRTGGSLQVTAEQGAAHPGRIILNGILLNILNPKLSLFFLAFLPQFVPLGSPHPALVMIELALIFMAVTLIVFIGYGLFAAATRRHITGRPAVLRWLRRGFAGAFGVLGLRLALSQI